MMDHQLSSHLELGSLKKAYRDQRTGIWFSVYMLITIILFFLVLLVSLVTIWYLAFLLPISLMFITVLVWDLRLDRTPMCISVYEEGLVYEKGHDHKVILWSDIRSIKYHVDIIPTSPHTPSAIHAYGFHGRDGETLLALAFDDTWQPLKGEIVKMIEQAASAILYPSVLEAYQQGKDCLFGDITLSLRGVYYNWQMLPWNRVKSFAIGRDAIQIKCPEDNFMEKWLKLPLKKVDNLEVMKKIIKVAADTHYFII